jgi:hypothetical protein
MAKKSKTIQKSKLTRKQSSFMAIALHKGSPLNNKDNNNLSYLNDVDEEKDLGDSLVSSS